MLQFQRNKTIPGLTTALEDAKGILWWGIRELVTTLPGIIVSTARWNNASSDQDILPQGLLLGKIRSGGKLKEWEPAATDGSEDIFGILMHEQNMNDVSGYSDRMVSVIVGGPLKPSGFYIDGTLAAGINAHAQELLIRAQLQNRCIFDDEPQMCQFGGWRNTKDKTAAYTLVEADKDTLMTNLGATADVVFTLPAPREGFRAGFFVAVDEKIVITSASGAPIIADGDATRSTIDLPPEIGTMVEILGISATQYIATIIPGEPRRVGTRQRFRLDWVAGANGVPAANADRVSDTGATSTIADPDFEILGSGSSTGDVTINPEGGVIVETDGGGTNAVIILPHLTASVTAWTGITWGTDEEVEWECTIKTGLAADIADSVIHAGLKLTNTPVTATDADQAFFRFAPATAGGSWEANYSINDVDVETDTGIDVAASTEYNLKISIDSDRFARFYINGVLVYTAVAAMTTGVDLIPYIGVLESAADAKTLYVRGQSISRNMGLPAGVA